MNKSIIPCFMAAFLTVTVILPLPGMADFNLPRTDHLKIDKNTWCGKRDCSSQERPSSGDSSNNVSPAADQLAQQHKQALDFYQDGLANYNKRNWAKAIERFWEAIKKWPDNPEFRAILDKAEAELRREREQQVIENEVENTRKAFEARRTVDLLEKERIEFEARAQSRETARKEQEEFDRMNAVWLKRQQEYIRQAADYNKKWKNEVLASIKAIRVPSPIFTPKKLDDVRTGDILLIGPDDSPAAQTIVRVDPLYRAIDYFSSGNVSQPELQKGRVSHTLTVVKAVNGELLFLDHTKNAGSRILNKEQYMKQYGRRGIYVARPQAKVDGRELWQAAREAALKRKSDYGLFFGNVVCSERAAIVVARATGLPLQEQHHRLGKRLGPIDVTPSDFFDGSHAGKYFLLSTIPILPLEKRSQP